MMTIFTFYHFINENFCIGFKTGKKNSGFSFKQVIILSYLLMHKLVNLETPKLLSYRNQSIDLHIKSID